MQKNLIVSFNYRLIVSFNYRFGRAFFWFFLTFILFTFLLLVSIFLLDLKEIYLENFGIVLTDKGAFWLNLIFKSVILIFYYAYIAFDISKINISKINVYEDRIEVVRRFRFLPFFRSSVVYFNDKFKYKIVKSGYLISDGKNKIFIEIGGFSSEDHQKFKEILLKVYEKLEKEEISFSDALRQGLYIATFANPISVIIFLFLMGYIPFKIGTYFGNAIYLSFKDIEEFRYIYLNKKKNVPPVLLCEDFVVINTGKDVDILKGYARVTLWNSNLKDSLQALNTSPECNYIFLQEVNGKNKTYKIYDINKSDFVIIKDKIINFDFSKDDKYFVYSNDKGLLKIYNLEKRQDLDEIKICGKNFALNSSDELATSLCTDKIKEDLPFKIINLKEKDISFIGFLTDNKLIYKNNNQIYVYDFKLNSSKKILEDAKPLLTFSDKLIFEDNYGYLKMFDISNEKIFKIGNSKEIKQGLVLQGGLMIIIKQEAGKDLYIYNLNNPEEGIFKFISLDGIPEYLAGSPCYFAVLYNNGIDYNLKIYKYGTKTGRKYIKCLNKRY